MHHTHARLDRAGKANSQGFRSVSHADLFAIVEQELTRNNGCWGAVRVWTRTNCIPMGGAFSAQGADLHSVWAAYVGRKCFRQLGRLEITTAGWPLWHTPLGRVTLCQFRDNILIATDTSPHLRAQMVERVRAVLKNCWNLEVECGCISKEIRSCTGQCCGSVTKAVGVVMILSDNRATAFAEPAALTPDWNLRLGPPLLSPHHPLELLQAF